MTSGPQLLVHAGSRQFPEWPSLPHLIRMCLSHGSPKDPLRKLGTLLESWPSRPFSDPFLDEERSERSEVRDLAKTTLRNKAWCGQLILEE